MKRFFIMSNNKVSVSVFAPFVHSFNSYVVDSHQVVASHDDRFVRVSARRCCLDEVVIMVCDRYLRSCSLLRSMLGFIVSSMQVFIALYCSCFHLKSIT